MFIKRYDYSMWSKHEEESTDKEESTDEEESDDKKVDLSNMLPEGDEEVKKGKGVTPD